MVNTKKKAFLNFALSALFLCVAFGGYVHRLNECAQMTFVSNTTTGLVLLFGGVFSLVKKRDIPHFLYLDCAVLMSSVIAACSIFAPGLCFMGLSILPHLVTPIAIIMYYLLCCDASKSKLLPQALTTVVFPSAYYIFMVLFGVVGGNAVYAQFDTNAMSVLNITLVGVAAVAGLFVVGVVLVYANKRLRGVAAKRQTAV